MTQIKVKLAPGVEAPVYAHWDDAGLDLQANITEPVRIHPGTCVSIPTGISVALPTIANNVYVYELQIRPRSGLAANLGLTVGNAPGTIDSGYRGEIKVILQNNSNDAVRIQPKQKIAQAVLGIAHKIHWDVVDTLEDSERGSGGFGSTDK